MRAADPECSSLSRIAEGLKLELLTSLLPSVNEKAAKINATYKKPNVHTVATLDVFKVSLCSAAPSRFDSERMSILNRPTSVSTLFSVNKVSSLVPKSPTTSWMARYVSCGPRTQDRELYANS